MQISPYHSFCAQSFPPFFLHMRLNLRVTISTRAEQIRDKMFRRDFMEDRDDERFKVRELIGEGCYGDVYRCYDTQKELDVAVKRIMFETKSDGLPSVILREISVLKEMEHRNVVRLLDVSEESEGVRLVFEFLSCNLLKFMEVVYKSKPMAPHLIKALLFQILQGVSYCHSQKILHRDLKPENLLLDLETDTIKIADLGHTRAFDSAPSDYSNDVTTAHYKAPELLLRTRQSTTAVDIWAVGCIFAEMVMRKPLFPATVDYKVLWRIIRIFGVPSEEEWEGVTQACLDVCDVQTLPLKNLELPNLVAGLEPEGFDLLSKMLRFLPHERISACEALQHPYYKGFKLPNK